MRLFFAIVVLGVFVAIPSAEAKRVHGVPVPGRALTKSKKTAKPVASGVYMSRLTFRRTVRYYRRYLKSRKIEHTAVPIYRYRGVVVARWLSKDPKTAWAAIQVFKRHAKTRIFIVPRPQPAKKP